MSLVQIELAELNRLKRLDRAGSVSGDSLESLIDQRDSQNSELATLRAEIDRLRAAIETALRREEAQPLGNQDRDIVRVLRAALAAAPAVSEASE